MKTIPFTQAIKMNRHQRRSLGKQNGVKIPSIKNFQKKPVDTKKADKFFNKLLNK